MADAEIRVRLTPRGGRNSLDRYDNGVLHARVTAPPVDGSANTALVDLLARSLGVRKSAIIIRSGQSSREKRLVIHGLDAAELEAAIQRKLDPS